MFLRALPPFPRRRLARIDRSGRIHCVTRSAWDRASYRPWLTGRHASTTLVESPSSDAPSPRATWSRRWRATWLRSRRPGCCGGRARSSAAAAGEVRCDGRLLADFASNDYLGLAADPRLARRGRGALESAGTGAAAARLITGTHPLHSALEADLARLKRSEAALLFPTGYAANTGAIPALVGAGDAVYSDALNHASLIDGCRLSRAAVRVFPDGDCDALEALLRADRGRYRRRLLVVDAVFSMDGDLFPLPRLVEIARRHDAWSYVDDAHGTGVLGRRGPWRAGALGGRGRGGGGDGDPGQGAGVRRGVHRGLAGAAGLAAESRAQLRLHHRDPARAGGRGERSHPHRGRRGVAPRAACASTRAGCATALAALGYAASGEPDGHIIPLVLGAADDTMRAAAALEAAGFLVGAVRPPTVAEGSARLRITLSAAHRTRRSTGSSPRCEQCCPPERSVCATFELPLDHRGRRSRILRPSLCRSRPPDSAGGDDGWTQPPRRAKLSA